MDRPKRKDLARIGDLIGRSLEHGFLGLAREMVRVFDVWESAVGSYNAAKTVPESVKGGVLTVLVESSVWIDRLSYFRKEFIDNLNRALGGPVIEEIVFKVGLDPAASSHSRPRRESGGPAAPPTMNDAEIESVLSGVTDPELKARLKDLLAGVPLTRFIPE